MNLLNFFSKLNNVPKTFTTKLKTSKFIFEELKIFYDIEQHFLKSNLFDTL